jgi:4-coumarate--CoA ligase
MISHQNVIAQCLQMKQITAPDYEKVLAILPLFHSRLHSLTVLNFLISLPVTGLVHILHLPVILNAEVIMLPKFSMKSMLDCVVEYQLKELIVVPPILIRFTRDPIVDQYDLSCLRRFSSGAAPLPDEVIQLLEKKFPNTGFKQGYGMTESCSCLTAHSPDMYDYKHAQSVGGIVPNTQIKFVDPSGKEGNKGHILAKGPQCAMGYLNNPVADKASFNSDGWLHTGDEGSIDDRGIVTITGRLKDIIKVKGIAVSPSELEELLLQHPKVNDAAVIGIPDSYSGERPKGYIVLSFGEQPSEKIKEELAQYVKDRKIRTKWLAEIELIDEIPRAGSGKILRRVLQDLSRETRKMEKARL